MSETNKDKINNLLNQLHEIDIEIKQLNTLIPSSHQRLKNLSENAHDILCSCLIEKQEGVYILNGRLPDNLVHSLKSNRIIRFESNDYLWYVDDVKQFVKRIEYRLKRGLDVSCAYTYKNTSQYKYENRLAIAIDKFYSISDQIEHLEKNQLKNFFQITTIMI